MYSTLPIDVIFGCDVWNASSQWFKESRTSATFDNRKVKRHSRDYDSVGRRHQTAFREKLVVKDDCNRGICLNGDRKSIHWTPRPWSRQRSPAAGLLLALITELLLVSPDVDILNGNGNLAASQWAMTSFGEVGNRNFRQQFRGDEDVASMDDEDESISIDEGLGLEATFDQMFANVTYIAGQTAILPCSIEHLAKLKVAWLDASGLPMTLEDRRIVDDTRFSVVRPLMSAWNLQIRDVRSEDSGRYRCTINTMPSRSKVVHLQVKVPAGINDSLWKNDITIQEFANLSLTCLATGVPKPEVTWRRRKEAVPRSPFDLVHTSEDIIDTNSLPSPRCLGTEPTDVISGTTLFISNVSRDCSGIYECTAANEVPPAVTRRVKVAVEFPPQVTMPNYRISQSRGRETILECQITANPQATSTWEKDGKQIQNKDPYYIEVFPDSAIGLNFNLRVRVVDESMYGAYKCRAANALGQDEGVIHLTEEKRHRHLQEHGGAQSVNVSGYQHQQQHYVISENSRGGGDTGLSGVRGQRHGQELQRPRSTGEKGERAPSSERVVSSSMSLPSKQSVAATASMTVLAAAAATAHLLFSRSLPLLWQRWLS